MKDRASARRTARLLSALSQSELGNLRMLLANARFEIFPSESAYQRVVERLPAGSVPLAVTMSFQKPISETVDLVKRLAAAGYEVAAHLSSRQFDSVEETEDVIDELRRRGIQRVVVIGGDASGDGPFPAAIKLLSYLRDRGNPFAEVGIAGHPEGHPQVPADVMMSALVDKAGLGTFVVTQLCFEPALIGSWAAQVRLNHLPLPIEVSIPGVVESERLARTLDLIGVGESRKRVKPGKAPYSPTELVVGLAQLPVEEHGIAGLHIATFNEIDATETWRQRLYDAARSGGGG